VLKASGIYLKYLGVLKNYETWSIILPLHLVAIKLSPGGLSPCFIKSLWSACLIQFGLNRIWVEFPSINWLTIWIPRDLWKEVEHKKMMKDVLTVEKKVYKNSSKAENFSVSHTTFSSVRGRHRTLSNRIVLYDSACFGLHYSIFLVHQLDRTLRIEKNFLKFQRQGRHPPSG
jgi:hypothetical protein